jgi:hypothetical protein
MPLLHDARLTAPEPENFRVRDMAKYRWFEIAAVFGVPRISLP